MVASSDYSPRDWLYLSMFEGKGKSVPKGHTEVLLANCTGELTTALVDSVVCDRLKANIWSEPWAALCLELTRRTYISFTVAIDDDTSDALNEILRLVFKQEPTGHNWTAHVTIPDYLTNHIQKAIGLGQDERDTTRRGLEERVKPLLSSAPAPPDLEQFVLDTTALQVHGSGFTVHKLIQLQKNKIADPSIILGRLHPDELTLPGLQKLLVLDSDGDLACSWVKTSTIDSAEENLKRFVKAKRKPGVIAMSDVEQGLMTMPLTVTRSQEKTLQEMKTHWGKTGYPPVEIPDDIRVLLRMTTLLADAYEKGMRAQDHNLH